MREQDGTVQRFNQGFHTAASRFLGSLDGAVRQAQVYEADNKTLQGTLERLERDLQGVFHIHAHFTFRGQDQNIIVNDERLRCGGQVFLQHQEFLTLLSERRVGGIAFHEALGREELREMITRIARYNKESPTPYQDLRESMQECGLWEKVEILPYRRAARLVLLQEREEDRVMAVRVYAKTMSLFRLYLENLDDPAHLGYYHLRLYRTVQSLAEVCRDRGWRYLGLVNNKRYQDYKYNHPTNVAMLSLILGVRLNLRRSRLSELGMAAILHDLGKLSLPQEFMNRRARFGPQERTMLREHSRLGVESLLKLRTYSESILKRIMVLREHHEPIPEGEEFHPYSRIIAVTETFDALTSRRPFRDAYLPDQAIQKMISLAGTRLDRSIVSIFVQTTGLYPSGTLLRLSTGELAIAFEPHPDPANWRLPIVRIITDSQGRPIEPPFLVDLAAGGDGGAPERAIVETVHPEKAGINTQGYLYTDADPGAVSAANQDERPASESDGGDGETAEAP